MKALNKARNQIQLARVLAVVIDCVVTIIAAKILFSGADMTNPVEGIKAL